MPMYNLLEYSDNYADSSASLCQFKRDEKNMTDAGNSATVPDDSKSSEYKSSLLGKPADNEVLENAKIAVPLKYLSKFFRSLEMPLINCKIHLELS